MARCSRTAGFDVLAVCAYLTGMARLNILFAFGVVCGPLLIVPPTPVAAQPVPPAAQPAPDADQPYHRTIKKPPATPQERSEILSNLYAHLATSTDSRLAAEIAATIERLWSYSGSDTIAFLMLRARKMLSEKRVGVALQLLDAVTELSPDYAEGWYLRATAHLSKNDFGRALGDLRRALALEPNHYKALAWLGRVLNDVGQKKGALQAYRQLVRVHPHWPRADDTIKELEREVEGQGI